MAQKEFRSLSTTQVAQVTTITITAASDPSGTAVWTLTLTDDDGSTATVTYTEDGSPTVSTIAAGLVAAWNASTQPDIARITAANPSGGVMTFTSDTAGRPHAISIADDDDGTHSGPTISTLNRGNTDYGDTRNWPTDAIPTSSDDVIIRGRIDIRYGLDQSSVAIGDFRVMPDHTAKIGRVEDGIFHYLQIDPDLLEIEGASPECLLDIGSAAIAPMIRATGRNTTSGRHAIYLLGSGITTLNVEKGDVGVAVNDGETATVATLQVSYVDNPRGDCRVELGSGVTLTTAHLDGGETLIKCAATTVNVAENAAFENDGSGAITTLNCYGTARIGSTGTVTTANIWGTLDARGATITTATLKSGGTIIVDDSTTITNFAPQSDKPGTFTIVRV